MYRRWTHHKNSTKNCVKVWPSTWHLTLPHLSLPLCRHVLKFCQLSHHVQAKSMRYSIHKHFWTFPFNLWKRHPFPHVSLKVFNIMLSKAPRWPHPPPHLAKYVVPPMQTLVTLLWSAKWVTLLDFGLWPNHVYILPQRCILWKLNIKYVWQPKHCQPCHSSFLCICDGKHFHIIFSIIN